MSAPAVRIVELQGDGAARARAAAEIRTAGLSHGCFVAQDHGLSDGLIEAAFAATRAFFALPLETKLRYEAGPDQFGYHPLHRSGEREKFLVPRPLDGAPPPAAHLWPVEVPGFAATITAFVEELEAVGRTILLGIAQSLGVEDRAFAHAFDAPAGGGLWLLHYPPAPPRAPGVPVTGAAAHSDLHPLALLVQDDVGGLEYRTGEGWVPVDARCVCQMGDVIGRWTNDLYTPNVHRVCNSPTRSRYSLCMFMQPPLDYVIAPLAACVDAHHPSRYPPATFGQCIRDWLRAVDEGRAGHIPDL